jgi:hypothetical protein
MKVSDLIKVLEEHKDKEFYHLSTGNPNYVSNIDIHIVDDNLFLEISGKHDLRFICDFESLDSGFTPRLRTEKELDIYRIQQKRESRQFDYYFDVGTEVVIDEDVLFSFHQEKFVNLLGKKGIIKKCESNFHAYGHGKSYSHVVEWENGYITQDTDWDGTKGDVECDELGVPKNYLPTIYLIKSESPSE